MPKGIYLHKKGYKLSEEHKRKISEIRLKRKTKLGYLNSLETRKKISEAHKGKHLSEETKKKMSEAHKGQIPWHKGKHLSEETRRKLSEVCRGEKHHNWKGGITKNREYRISYNKEWKKKNKEHYKEYIRNYEKRRRKNPKHRIDSNISLRIRESLKGRKAGRKWENLVDYTIGDLTKHLESKFESWMNWNNYGKWEIDHVKPRSLFKYETAEDPEFKKCWALENLQPLEKIANIKKGNKFLK